MDILYAANILNTIDKETSEKLLSQKDDMDKSLIELDKNISVKWLKETLQSENKQLSDFVKKVYLLSDEFNRIIMAATKPQELKDSTLNELINQIEKKMEVDLKDLILYVSNRISDPQLALDRTLENLSRLFKSNNVEIKVKYRKR